MKNSPSANIPLDAYTHDHIRYLMKKTPKSMNFVLIESSPIRLRDVQAKKVVYTVKSPTTEEIKTMEILAINSGKLYNLVFAAESSKFSIYLPTIEKIIESLDFITVQANEFNSYHNSTFGIKIQYPRHWKVDEKFYDKEDDRFTKVVGFLSPSETHRFRERLATDIRNIPAENTSFEDYSNFYLDRLRKKYAILVSSAATIDKGNPAHKVLYTSKHRIEKYEFKAIDLWTLRDGKAYHILYSDYLEEFDSNFPSILKIVGSFETFATPSIKNNMSSLSVSFEVGKKSIDRGEDQNISVRISNEKSNIVVAGAKVTGELFHPSGQFNTLGERNTDEEGQVLYSLTIGDKYETGEYRVILRIYAEGYETKTVSTTFKVRPTSPASV
jgi:hypothetical protein